MYCSVFILLFSLLAFSFDLYYKAGLENSSVLFADKNDTVLKFPLKLPSNKLQKVYTCTSRRTLVNLVKVDKAG